MQGELMIDTCAKTFLLATLMLSALTGCVGINAIHHQARAGDTVFLALGSPAGMTRNNVTVTFTPADGSGNIDLTNNVRALFKLLPEKTSPVYLDNTNTYFSWNHEPWLMTMGIDLPWPMPEGPGTVRISCVPAASCKYPPFHPHVNNIAIGLEILPGQGEPNPLAYLGGFGTANTLDLTTMEASPQLVLTPSTNASVNRNKKFGAASISINMPAETTSGAVVPDAYIKVIPNDLTVKTNSQRQLSWTRTGDVITVYIVSPTGMTYIESTFSIVLHAAGGGVKSVFVVPPTIISSTYYDANGRVINGPTLELALK
jgi:hypothetical protein